jgi:hypothetical protein
MVETALLRNPDITPQQKALYGLLITYGPQRIFPGQQTLADCLGATRQTVSRWLGELKETGLIGWERRTGTSNKYYILGYENYNGGCNASVTGDVTPTLQGCNTHVTGDVTPVLHYLEPIKQEPTNQNQEQKDLPPAASLWPDDIASLGEPEPKPDPVAAFKARHNPVEVMTGQETRRKRAQVEHPDYADPDHDDDVWVGAFRVFCISFLPGADIDRMPDKKRGGMVRELRRLAMEVRATPQRAIKGIRDLAALEAWMVGPAATPFNTRWAEAFQNTLIGDERLIQAQIAAKGKRNGGRAPPVEHRYTGPAIEYIE